ncbi:MULTISPECIES: hypothetical protein [unclassified Bacillus (in: firmicutes)]|uniref:hypothetical protein n=1 Tax=Bacillus TaxID=1386 RepID=UPI00114EAFF8|nr:MULTISPECIES: hypothetical protein [unclassified Bacillus (in: firmicutes)]MCC2930729.1 hypothetical protein [Bacillus sp. LBG-1-113]TQK01722.1 hypothetical protein FB592_0256 [Bacillus sp. SJZ110]
MRFEKLSDFIGRGAHLLFNFPLYTKIKIETSVETKDEKEILSYDEETGPLIINHTEFIEGKDLRFLKSMVLKEHNFYHYCPFCKKETPIIYKRLDIDEEYKGHILSTYSYIWASKEYELYEESAYEEFAKRYKEFTENILDENRSFQMNFECTSKEKHRMYVIFHLTKDNYLIKTGQYPSIMDFDNSLQEYKKIVKNKDIIKELNSATILKTHNYGVASFLYLRRIFENLIFEKLEQAKAENKIDEQKFMKSKMKEKVKMLHEQGYVPDFLKENNTFVYGILSKGVHQLTEKECLANFDTLRTAILIILEEKIEAKRKEKLKKETKLNLSKINSDLSK